MLKKYRFANDKNKSMHLKTMAIAALAGLGFMGTQAQAEDAQPTLDKIKNDSTGYLGGSHALYDLATEQGENTSSITIGGTTYYYTPQSSEAAALTNLVKTGASALVETNSSAGAVFSLTDPETSTTTYYTYDTSKLPQSVYSATESTADDYTYSLQTSEGTKYFKVDLNTSRMGSDDVTWTKVTEAGENTIEITLPHNGSTETLYYQYTGTLAERIGNTTGMSDITGNHIGNSSTSSGGAIYNSNKISSITGNFIGNTVSTYTDSGGAIYNNQSIGSITGDFIANTAGNGGAIFTYNNTTIGSITGDFIANSATYTNAGAIYNNAGTISNITGNFIGNTTKSGGGAIYNANGTIRNITGDFTGNKASAYGGAIYSHYGSTSNLTGDFIGNTASSSSSYARGGAIYQNYGTFDNITGDFIENSARSTNSSVYGGAIYKYNGTIGSITGDFIGNTATSAYRSSYAQGGAIYNDYGTIGSITGNFTNNSAIGDRGQGGAIYNNGTISSVTGEFRGNTVDTIDDDTYVYGGAIYNSGTMNIVNSSFYNNSASNDGGAIYNSGKLTLTANDGYTSVFDGNTADGVSNAITFGAISSGNTITFNATDGGKFIINDGINFSSGVGSDKNVLNFNGENAGDIQMNNTIEGITVNVNHENVLNGSELGLKNSTLNLANSEIGTMALDSLTSENSKLKIDIDLDNIDADKIVVTTTNQSSGVLTITNLNFLSDKTEWETGYKVQILELPEGNTLQLALDEELKKATLTNESYNEISNTVHFGDKLQGTGTILGLATTNTENDSLEYHVETIYTDNVLERLLAKETNADRQFIFTNGSQTYTVGDLYNDGVVTDGNLSIISEATGGTKPTLDLGSTGSRSGYNYNFQGKTLTFNKGDVLFSDIAIKGGRLVNQGSPDGNSMTLDNVTMSGTTRGTVSNNDM